MSRPLSTRPLTLRQLHTLDKLDAYDPAAKVVGWMFYGPLIRVQERYVYILPDGAAINVPRAVLFPNEE
jgi:hypothetical protein